MAAGKSGSFTIATKNSAISGYVSWSETYSETNNGSDIVMVAYLRRTNNYSGTATNSSANTITATFSCTGKSDISVKNPSRITIPNNKNYVEIARATFENVPHNSDGSKSVDLYFTLSHTSGMTGFTVNKTGTTASLTQIPRASEPTCSDVTLGNAVTINTNRLSGSFTHTIKTSINGVVKETFTSVATSKSWTPQVATYAPYITNGKTGTIKIECSTYNGSTLIGTKSCNITVTVPSSVKPSLTVTIEENNTKMKNLNWGIFVQGKSQLKVSNVGSPIYGSPISSYSTNVEGINYSGATINSNVILQPGTKIVKSKVIDARGNYQEKETSYQVVEYAKPSIIEANAIRCLEDGTPNDRGTYIKCTFLATVSSVSNHNKATFKIGYKLTESSSYVDTTFVTESSTQLSIDKTGENSVIIGGGNISGMETYDVRFLAEDLFEPTEIVKSIGTGFAIINVNESGKAIAFGKISEAGPDEEKMEIAIPVEYLGKKLLDYEIVDEWEE